MDACPPDAYPEQWNIAMLREKVGQTFGLAPPFESWLEEEHVEPELIEERIRLQTDEMMERKMAAADASVWRQIEKSILLERLDFHWKEHLATRSEEHTSELQSLMRISYAVFCLKKKK